MNSKKVFYVLLGVLCLIVLAAFGGTFYGTGVLKKTGDTLYERKLAEAVLEKEEQALEQAKRDIEEYGELEQIAKAIVPQEKDQARTVREIIKLADRSNIDIARISFPQSTLGSETKTGSAKAKSKTPAAPKGTTQLVPVEGLKEVFAMPIEVESKARPVTYAQLLAFLRSLEQNRRTSHVTSISITPDIRDGNLVTFKLTINAYIKP